MKNKKVRDVILAIATIIMSYLVFNIIPIEQLEIENVFLREFIGEAVFAIIILLFVILLKHLDIYQFNIDGLKNGWTAGLPLIFVIAIVSISAKEELAFITVSTMDICLFLGEMFLVGFCEETLIRGLVQNSIHNLMGENKIFKIRGAIFITGIIFGLMHMINARIIGFLPALAQAIGAAFVGMMIGAIYYRTNKNLWYVIVLHALNDAVGLVAYGHLSGVATDTILEVANNYNLTEILVPVVFYGIITMILLRKKKIEHFIIDSQTNEK